MTKISKTIVFFGNERLATGVTTDVSTLRSLILAGYKVAAVISHNEQGRSRSNRQLEVEVIAKSHQIPVFLPERPVDLKEKLLEFGAEIGILVAYGKIIPQSIIDLFPHGIVNIHPSLLPLHRGPTPIESVILNGELKTGISIMQLVKEMDAGPILGQREIVLSGQETKQELTNLLLHEGSSLLLKLLPDILNDSIQITSQNELRATYDTLLHTQDGFLDWQKSARQLEREIRAFAIWPRSRTTIGGIDIVVTSATVVKESIAPGQIVIRDKTVLIGTTNNSFRINTLIPAGKKEMPISAFLAGYGKLLSRSN